MRPNRLHKLTCICCARLTLCALLVILWTSPCFAVTDTLREIAHKGSNGRITHEFPLLTDVKWDIVVTNSDGRIRNINGAIFDTVNFEDPLQLTMTTKFAVAPALFKKPLMLRYECAGSIVIKFNRDTLVRTGRYDTGAAKKDEVAKSVEFALWVPTDSLVQVEVTYMPPAKIGTCAISEISLVERVAYERSLQADNSSIKSSYALGFYYLAFGIVFLILFLNFRSKQEYLFFALFSIIASLSWLVGKVDNRLIAESSFYLVILALEFLSMVLARVMLDRNRSFIPLAVIICLILLSFTPVIHENYIHVFTQYIPIYKLGLGTAMMFYCAISAIYYLFQGFGQKKWEARILLYFCLAGMVIGMVIPYTAAIILEGNIDASMGQWMSLMVKIGFGIFPLGGVMLLGKRNGLDQKRMIKQIASIEKLSGQNLEKEAEKKQLLERQKSELEQKVGERTAEVHQQKEIIEIKNRAITDNLIYAQRIQAGILPDLRLINDAFSQSFIIYLPKDIVSGDFYAFTEKGDQKVLVVGDCTGHGVTGAFMSMIGSSLLNGIIADMKLIEPHIVLNKLNAAVINTLKQGENDSSDGMDISICVFDTAAGTISYAGANRPLWMIRNGEFSMVKPDKYPIGGLQVAIDRQFNCTTLPLKPGDTFYIFTDGYSDQFGGDQGKKMMSGKFREILMNIQELDMASQGAYLEATFRKWKGDNEQVDDVLVAGVRW